MIYANLFAKFVRESGFCRRKTKKLAVGGCELGSLTSRRGDEDLSYSSLLNSSADGKMFLYASGSSLLL